MSTFTYLSRTTSYQLETRVQLHTLLEYKIKLELSICSEEHKLGINNEHIPD